MSKIPVPTLTLTPEAAEPVSDILAPVEIKASEIKENDYREVQLTEEEKKMADDFARQINISDPNVIMQYGTGSQKKMTEFAEGALSVVRTKDLGAIGGMLTNVVTELKGFAVEEKSGGILGFFKKKVNKLESLKTKYDKAEANIDKVVEKLEEHQVTLLKDIAMLDKMFELNKVYFKELSMYIIAGKKKLESVRKNELAELTETAKRTGRQEDIQAASDMRGMCDRFEKRLHDLELTRTVSLQTGPQIRLVQGSNMLMSEKIQSTINNTIPLWKSQMVISIGLAHSNEAAKAQSAVTDATNELLRRNAESLQIAATESAKASERSIIDIDTLKYTNEKLISTLDEVMRIQDEGREKRRQAESELLKIENELKDRLLRIKR